MMWLWWVRILVNGDDDSSLMKMLQLWQSMLSLFVLTLTKLFFKREINSFQFFPKSSFLTSNINRWKHPFFFDRIWTRKYLNRLKTFSSFPPQRHQKIPDINFSQKIQILILILWQIYLHTIQFLSCFWAKAIQAKNADNIKFAIRQTVFSNLCQDQLASFC